MSIPKTRVPHYVAIGSNKYAVDLPDIYSELTSVVGTTKATGTEVFVGGGSAAELVRLGQAIKITVSYLDGTKLKNTTILCDIDKVAGAIKAIKGKKIAGMVIRSARIARRAKFR